MGIPLNFVQLNSKRVERERERERSKQLKNSKDHAVWMNQNTCNVILANEMLNYCYKNLLLCITAYCEFFHEGMLSFLHHLDLI